MDDDLAGELQCPVCLELLTWPIILPCSHVLCRTPCAERLFDRGFVRCPVCRDNSFVSGGIQNLPRVISLEHIIEHYQNPPPTAVVPALPLVIATGSDAMEEEEYCSADDIPCQLCDSEHPKKARKSCIHCNASYCSACLKVSHPNRLPFTEHKLVEPRKYPKPKELRCLHHDAMVNMFCEDCQSLGCLLCATDEGGVHVGHQTVTLMQAVTSLKVVLAERLQQLESNLEATGSRITNHSETMASIEQSVRERRCMINQQCDALINEVEIKRGFFLSDLEYEEKSKVDLLLQQIERFQLQSTNVENLIHFTREVLRETEPCTFIQLAKSVMDKVTKNIHQISETSTSQISLSRKVVDFRKEKAIIKDMAYLTVPNTPHIDVSKCSRSTSSVVLVLGLPSYEYDVIDGYNVFYSTDRERSVDRWEMVSFMTPGEARKCSRTPPTESAICLMHNNLQAGTVYYFSVIAYNATGQSKMSDIVQCHTLSASQTTLPVPEIVEDQSRAYTYSIQLHSPSPLDDPPDSGIAHYLLYREASVNKIWKSISLYGRVDHRVFGLAPDTMYDFVIMACDKNSECQVSNMVTMKTERSAY